MTERPLDAGDSELDQLPVTVVAAVVTPANGPRECTLYPADVPEEVVLTTWMTAKEGSFVALEDVR